MPRRFPSLALFNLRMHAQTAGDTGRVQIPIDWDGARRAQKADRARGAAVAEALRIDASRLEAIKLPVLVLPAEVIRTAGQLRNWHRIALRAVLRAEQLKALS